jgi:DUF4097 and DUF4098 domain-containing protein YvlB
MKKTLLTLTCLSLLNGCVIYVPVPGDLNKRQQVLELPASDLAKLIADTGAGSLTIAGEQGRSNVEVKATIYYYDDKDIQLSLERRGDSAILKSFTTERYYGANEGHIDLTVTVPASFALKLDDGSGDIAIAGLQGDLQINDDSGNLVVQGGHNIRVVDGSGHLQISAATGDVDIKDGSGRLQVREVKGNVTIRDGSGDIDVDQAGSLSILEDSSGKVSIHNIRGSVTTSSK